MELGAPQSPQVLRIGGDSSPCSAESSFRELDDVFLQMQTRVWLGEVLQTRLNEQLNVSDLLADGELLFEVSRVVWKMLLMRHTELKHIKAYKYEPFASRKRSGRYMPYSNVDSFLKICKILGLSGIDLFSPSDIVEKRDTRKVCMCIRSLSKKARSKHLNVPDFDIVSYMVVMPTDMVQCIRRSLELLQSRLSSSGSQILYQDSMAKCRQKDSVAASAISYDSCSEESDDTESNIVFQSDSTSATYSYDASSLVNSDLIDSPGASSVVRNHALGQNSLQLDVQNQVKDEYVHRQFESQCLEEPAGSLCSRNVEHDYQLAGMSSPSSVVSLIHLSGRGSHVKYGFRHSIENSSLDFNDVHLDLGSGASIVESSMGSNTTETSYTTDRLAISNMICYGTDTSPFLLVGEHSILKASTSAGSHGSNSTQRTSRNRFRSKLSDVDDVVVSSTASMSSVSGAVLNLDFDDQFDAEDDNKAVWSAELQNYKTYLFNNKTMSRYNTLDMVKDGILLHGLAPDPEKPHSDIDVKDADHSTKLFLPCSDNQSHTSGYSGNFVSYNNGNCKSQLNTDIVYDERKLSPIDSNASRKVPCDQCEEFLLGQSHSPLDFHPWDQKGKFAIATISNGNGPSLISASQEGLHEVITTKAIGDAVWLNDMKSDVADNDKEIIGATIIESYEQPKDYSQRINFDIDITYEESNVSPDIVGVKGIENSPELRSKYDNSDFQHYDLMLLDISGQGRHIVDAVVGNPSVHHDFVIPPNPIEPKPTKYSCSPIECSENAGENSHQVFTSHSKDLVYCPDNMVKVHQDDRNHEKVDMSAVANLDGTEDVRIGTAKCKPHKRPLLKSVVRGTAFLGVLFLLHRLRKSGREKTGESSPQSNQIRKENSGSFSSQKGHKGGRMDGVYPAEKLNFGD